MVTNWAKGQVVVGYVRSSGKGDDAQRSVPLQKQAIQECAAGAGGQVSYWYVDDARHTVSFQERKIEKFVAEDGMQVVASYVEGGYDGDGVEQSALQRLLAAAQSGERAFDVVLVYSLPRLSRRIEALHVFLSLLRDSGVEVVSVSEGYTPSPQAALYTRVSQVAQEEMMENPREITRKGIARARRMRKS